MNPLDLDGRRLESRANERIREAGLQDSYGQSGGLIATYDTESHVMTIEDEAVKAEWHAEDDHSFLMRQWDEMACFIDSCTDNGCLNDHQHYEQP